MALKFGLEVAAVVLAGILVSFALYVRMGEATMKKVKKEQARRDGR